MGKSWDWSNQDNSLAENVMQAIASTDADSLQTTELNYYTSGSLDDALPSPFYDAVAAYTYYPTYYEVLQQYNSGAATVPTFMEEGYYEGVTNSNLTPPTATSLMLRKQAYWTVLSGGLAGYMGGTQYYDFHTG